MSVLTITHLVCAAAFAFLAGLIALSRPSNRTGYEALLACILTAIWAGATAFAGFGLAGAIPVLDSLRTLAWLVFVCSLLLPPDKRFRTASGAAKWLIAATVLAALVLIVDIRHFAAAPTQHYFGPDQVLCRIGLGVLGILLIENLFRNSMEAKRWSIAPICIGLGGIFVSELIVYSDAFLFQRMDENLLATRAIASVLAVPLIALAMVRNRNWRVDIHVSRKVIFHSATIIASGIFLLSVSVVGALFRVYGGRWGVVVQLSLILGGLLILAMALASRGIRSRLKHAVAENFFSHRYDYRAEWVKFIDALSSGNAADLEERIIRAVADIVDSPGGILWVRGNGDAYRPSTSWNLHVPDGTTEPIDSPFIAALGNGAEIQLVAEVLSRPSVPNWLRAPLPGWVVVPLAHDGQLVGFILLAKPRAPFNIDWEVLQLLRIVGKQSASYLSESEATRALADAKLLAEYSKRFAFVVHDIKNLVSQLKLVLSNAERVGNNPAFQEDALLTIRSSVERMNKLLQQLGSAQVKADSKVTVDVEKIIREVVAGTGGTQHVVTDISGCAPRALIEPMALNSVLTHLLNNAVEASGPHGKVTVRVEALQDRVAIDICDQGPGMEASFIRNELFRPLRSTKDSGYGIGAFQSRELVRAAGGDLEVLSRPGSGTTMRIVLPVAVQPQAHAISSG